MFNPFNFYLMKTFILLLLAFGLGNPTTSIDDGFDAFTEVFFAALQTGDPDIYGMYLADHVRYIHPGGQPDTLSTEQMLAKLARYGQPHQVLSHLSRGFVRLDHDDGPAFVSLFNQAGERRLVRINGNSVRLRKLPGTKSAVIALFNAGIFDGRIAAETAPVCDRTSGIDWLKMSIHHPKVGWVEGFIASDYVTLLPSNAPKAVKAELIQGQWFITEISTL